MAKKELLDSKLLKDVNLTKGFSGASSGNPSKGPGLSGKSFGIIKFILGILFLPFVYSACVAFLNEFALVDKALQWVFWSGVICFLAVYLFILEPVFVYNYGHKLVETVFSFFKPMVNVAPFLLPVYALLVFVVYGVLSIVVKSGWLIKYALFLIGFSAILHLVFSAKSIRTKKVDFLKGNNIFGFSFILILNLALLALGFSLIFKEFSFVNFCNISFTTAHNIFYAVFKQLFLF
jgi:hypothetical protein